jgi:hypothetical protein
MLTSSLDGGKWSASHLSPLVRGEGIVVAIEWEALTTIAVPFVLKGGVCEQDVWKFGFHEMGIVGQLLKKYCVPES